MKFSEMKYERMDVAAICAKCAELTDGLKRADTFAKAEAAFLEYDRLHAHIDTMCTIAYIRHTINTEDKFYSDESDFIDESTPLLEEPKMNWALALTSSPFRPDFEKKYGELFLKDMEMDLKTFRPEIVPDLQEENKLVSEYVKLYASAQVPFEGGTYTISQLAPYREDADDARRRAAWDADGNWWLEHGDEFDRNYDELVRVRTKMARKLGYEDYTQLGYYRMTRNSYDRRDVEKFRDAVVKYIVPVADRLYREKAKRTGVPYPLSYADVNPMFRSGNAKPCGTPEEILAHAREFYHELSPETSEFIDAMFDGEMMDVLSRKGKMAGGYETEIRDYKCPFIFANFNGTSDDVETMTHEAGHAFASYTARDFVPEATQSPTLDACEIHSMSMEFFAWPWEEGFFGGETLKFKYSHLAGALEFIPYGCLVDHFQHEIYAAPDMTPAERHETWKRLVARYMPWLRLGEVPFYGDGRYWQRQLHIYESPFYYIDYCLAQTVALEFWAAMQQDRQDAWRRYYDLVKLGGRRNFTGLVQAAKLPVPFEEDALATVSAAAVKWLDSVDMSGIE